MGRMHSVELQEVRRDSKQNCVTIQIIRALLILHRCRSVVQGLQVAQGSQFKWLQSVTGSRTRAGLHPHYHTFILCNPQCSFYDNAPLYSMLYLYSWTVGLKMKLGGNSCVAACV